MKRVFFFACMAFLSACANLEPKMVTSMDLDIQQKLLFTSDYAIVKKAVIDSIKEKKWLLLYEGRQYPEGERSKYSNKSHNPFSKENLSNESTEVYDRLAIEKSLRANAAPTYYMQAKTPTSSFSYGAEIFIIFFEFGSDGTEIAITAASGQALEKEKLGAYIQELSSLVHEKIN